MHKHKIASFFTGIGGFDIAFEHAGFQTVFQSDIDKFCIGLLRDKWPDLPFQADILKTEPQHIPDADVWTAGFPCQDLSVARGNKGRTGLAGKRSGLFFKLADLMRRKRPRVVLLENVHGLLNANAGKDFAELLHTLNGLGYAVSWRLLNSRYFGVPQSRPRMYICAWMGNPEAAGNTLFESEIPERDPDERRAFLEASQGPGGVMAPRVAFCLAATSGRHTGTDWSRTYIAYKDRVRRLTPLECERLQGFPDGWTRTAIQYLDSDRQESLRYHSLGNAVSVPTVKWVANRMRTEISKSDSVATESRAKKFHDFAKKSWPSLAQPGAFEGTLKKVRTASGRIAWPTAGILWRGKFIARHTVPAPCVPVKTDLIDIIESGFVDQRYFLSPNAAEGILRRVDHQGRTLFAPLRGALERLSGRYSAVRSRHKLAA